MSDQPNNLGANANPLQASDWSGTETLSIEVSRADVSGTDATLYRYLNGLDVNVDITIDGTHVEDGSLTWPEELRGSGSESEPTLTVESESADSDLITEPWERLTINVTPASNPSSGEFELRSIGQGVYRA
jgi:hypothetical protein